MSISLAGLNANTASKLNFDGGILSGNVNITNTLTAPIIGNAATLLYGNGTALSGIGRLPPTIATIQVTDASYNTIDDTAVAGGGFMIVNGSGFLGGALVKVGGTVATSTTGISMKQLRVQLPAKTAGTHNVQVDNEDGSYALAVNAVTFSAFPAWSTGSTLPEVFKTQQFTQTLSAPSDSTVTYTGTGLPAGTTLETNGTLSGTIVESSTLNTTYSFTVQATDLENQNTPRTFLLSAYGVTYVYTSHTFTNASATLYTGPTLASVRAAYTTTWDDTYLNMSVNGIQLWTVPKSGNYTITAKGGQGGASATASGYRGGYGMIVQSTHFLMLGSVVQILVGQIGENNPYTVQGNLLSGAGGGGSFVAVGSTLLLAAGGGGGGGSFGFGQDGLTSTSGGAGATAGATAGGSGGTNGGGGGGGTYTNGGAGYTGDGGLASNGQNRGTAPKSFTNGGLGGIKGTNPSTAAGSGGFGGGSSSFYGGGGGGGYSGGGGGSYTSGGGGGSYASGPGGGGGSYSATTATFLGSAVGVGYVTIAFVG